MMMLEEEEDSGSGREDKPNVVVVALRDIVHISHPREAAVLHRRKIPFPGVEAEDTRTDELVHAVTCPKSSFHRLQHYCCGRAEAALQPQHACSR